MLFFFGRNKTGTPCIFTGLEACYKRIISCSRYILYSSADQVSAHVLWRLVIVCTMSAVCVLVFGLGTAHFDRAGAS